MADNDVARRDPFRFGRHAPTTGAVDEDTGISVDNGRALRSVADLPQEYAEAFDGLGTTYRLVQFRGTGRVTGVGGEVS